MATASDSKLDALKLLLESRAIDPDSRDIYSRTLLFHSIQKPRYSYKVDPGARDSGRLTPFAYTTYTSNTDAIRLLIVSRKVGMVKLLLGYDTMDLNVQDDGGLAPLAAILIYIYKKVVEKFLHSGRVEDVDSRDKNGRTPLWWAARNDRRGVGRALLAHAQPDVDAKDDEGVSSQEIAATHGHVKFVEMMRGPLPASDAGSPPAAEQP
ncbi:uncharacterized protein DNG_04534 [Cephalotrichum gorgonifer]|uniref:Ankyrin n=1 Tax=Cephalotrichum gorgonifer TaxID=2041049 RepID=A0AAE8SUN3_9PEZI|nr:uncharacterized protein DNG_04534 [Cephalotrichum gorgonifer]